MAKRKVIRKSNRPFTYNPHYYSWGGDFIKALGDKPFSFSGKDAASLLTKEGVANTIGSAVGNTVGGAIGGGLKSGAGSAISNVGGAVGGIVGKVNPLLGAAVTAASGIIGGVANRAFGSKLNEEKIAEVESSNATLNKTIVNSDSAESIEDQWSSQNFGEDFTRKSIGKDGWFSNKAKKKYKELKLQQDIARNRTLTAYENAAEALDTQNDLNAIANYAALGGPLGIWGGYGSGAIDYELTKEDLGIKALNAASKDKLTSLPNSFESLELNTFADGGDIHIKPSKRGTFTAAAKKHGKSVQSFASQVLANKENYSPAMVKKANFARNASKWHSFGGDLNTHGADFSNGQIIVGNGGTHEENLYEGVPMGMDAEGVPNLVEQGEVIFDDYVFSNRLFADKELLEKFGLPKSYDRHSFASIAEKLGAESKERPNDPISKRGLLDSMFKLQQVQETVRQQNQEKAIYENRKLMKSKNKNKKACGGKIGRLYEGTGDIPQFLRKPEKPNYIYDWNDMDTPVFSGHDFSPNSDAGIVPVGSYDSSSDDSDEEKKGTDLTWLRYAPIVGAAIGLGQNLFNKPDYSSVNAILKAANQAGNYTPVRYNPIGNYLQYKPFDRNFYLTKLNAQAGATRRAIMNTTNPARNAALLAADYNAQSKLGDLARQAEEYNLSQRQAVEQFNRGTNQANAEMGLKAAMANQDAQIRARSSRLSGIAQAMSLKDTIKARRDAAISANLTNLFQGLGDIGTEEVARNQMQWLINHGYVPMQDQIKRNYKRKNGGKLLTKRK
nr:MAG TPA: hypothetical protein [Crassvirales sp.]